jgi:hypothetical protein
MHAAGHLAGGAMKREAESAHSFSFVGVTGGTRRGASCPRPWRRLNRCRTGDPRRRPARGGCSRGR